MKKCLVIGGAGFLGSHLISALLKAGVKVRCFDRVRSPILQALDEKADEVIGDFTAQHLLADAMNGCDAVFHLASSTLPKNSNDDPDFDVSTNVVGTLRLLDQAVASKVKRFIFTSSGGTVYGIPQTTPIKETHPTHPTCSYGIGKLAIEKYLRLYHQLHGLSTCSLRIANPYGEYQRWNSGFGAVATFCHKAVAGETIEIWGDGSVERDFIYVGDVVEAMQAALKSKCSGLEINIGSGRATSLNALLDDVGAILGRRIERKYMASRSFDVPSNVLDIALAREVLGWTPSSSLSDGLVKTINWMKS